ncbi:uncharacterized protein LOC120528577 [Polypterus senegalus]|uniref:uncharacterized protein LOC120528577 n=1 Tax=Polypterus senegalus TaxID=55291 RepID=UPI0019656C3C|nr:uncharacterized protein LOC120528577 [Polypterus senegalus]
MWNSIVFLSILNSAFCIPINTPKRYFTWNGLALNQFQRLNGGTVKTQENNLSKGTNKQYPSRFLKITDLPKYFRSMRTLPSSAFRNGLPAFPGTLTSSGSGISSLQLPTHSLNFNQLTSLWKKGAQPATELPNPSGQAFLLPLPVSELDLESASSFTKVFIMTPYFSNDTDDDPDPSLGSLLPSILLFDPSLGPLKFKPEPLLPIHGYQPENPPVFKIPSSFPYGNMETSTEAPVTEVSGFTIP